VLDTSRIEAGTFSYRFDDIDIGEVVRDSVAGAGVGQDEIVVTADVGEGIPRVRGDGDRLRQVLTNLIENAVKYSPSGEEVSVVAYRQDSRVHVEVIDRGPGVSPEQQRLIFEKFGRAASPGSPGKPGTGLGLFIARSIAEAHGGALDVLVTGEAGATFRLTLPFPAGGA
jgi:signal transduction histidine kinase